MTSKFLSRRAQSSITSSIATSPRLDRLHTHQQRAERLNYVAIAIVGVMVLYVLVTIVRPLFFSTRPGKVTQDFGCISKSTMSDCSASSH